VRKILVALAALAALLIPASATAADKSTATLPDQQLWPLAAYDLTIGWLVGTVQNATFTDASIVQTSDTTSVVQGQLCGDAYYDMYGTVSGPISFCTTAQLTYTYTLDCFSGTFHLDAYEPTNTVALEEPVRFENTVQVTHVSLNPLSYDFTAADAKDHKAICSAKEDLTDPKKPPTTTEEVAILNDLIAELQSP
jgi:hypothetical protein